MTDRISINNLTSEQLDELYDQLARLRAALQIADDIDVTDWQRGYRACADRALAALDEPAYNGPTVTEATSNDRRWPLEKEGE